VETADGVALLVDNVALDVLRPRVGATVDARHAVCATAVGQPFVHALGEVLERLRRRCSCEHRRWRGRRLARGGFGDLRVTRHQAELLGHIATIDHAYRAGGDPAGASAGPVLDSDALSPNNREGPGIGDLRSGQAVV